MPAITATTSATDPSLLAGAASTSSLPIQTLDQQDFLKLLVAQMTQQDPMNPESNLDFSAQLAQFSTLQATNAMQSSQQFLQATTLIGRSVVLQDADQATVSGVVSAVQMVAGTPMLVINGQSYDLSQVTAVAPAPPQTASATATPTSAPTL